MAAIAAWSSMKVAPGFPGATLRPTLCLPRPDAGQGDTVAVSDHVRGSLTLEDHGRASALFNVALAEWLAALCGAARDVSTEAQTLKMPGAPPETQKAPRLSQRIRGVVATPLINWPRPGA